MVPNNLGVTKLKKKLPRDFLMIQNLLSNPSVSMRGKWDAVDMIGCGEISPSL